MARRQFLLTFVDGSRKHIGRAERDELLAQDRIKQTASTHYVEKGYFNPPPYLGPPSGSAMQGSLSRFNNFHLAPSLKSWAARQIRQSREDNAPGVHTEEQWIERVKYFGWRCRYCKDLLTLKTLTKDHQIPLSRRGSQWASNLVPACQSCNSSKRDRKPTEWRVIAT